MTSLKHDVSKLDKGLVVHALDAAINLYCLLILVFMHLRKPVKTRELFHFLWYSKLLSIHNSVYFPTKSSMGVLQSM